MLLPWGLAPCGPISSNVFEWIFHMAIWVMRAHESMNSEAPYFQTFADSQQSKRKSCSEADSGVKQWTPPSHALKSPGKGQQWPFSPSISGVWYKYL